MNLSECSSDMIYEISKKCHPTVLLHVSCCSKSIYKMTEKRRVELKNRNTIAIQYMDESKKKMDEIVGKVWPGQTLDTFIPLLKILEGTVYNIDFDGMLKYIIPSLFYQSNVKKAYQTERIFAMANTFLLPSIQEKLNIKQMQSDMLNSFINETENMNNLRNIAKKLEPDILCAVLNIDSKFKEWHGEIFE